MYIIIVFNDFSKGEDLKKTDLTIQMKTVGGRIMLRQVRLKAF